MPIQIEVRFNYSISNWCVLSKTLILGFGRGSLLNDDFPSMSSRGGRGGRGTRGRF